MHSVKSVHRAVKEETRRSEIITAAIHTLAEAGYGNASLARIASNASISTSLILYHFKDKEELMSSVVNHITMHWTMHVQREVRNAGTNLEKLHAYIGSNLDFMVKRPEFMAARIELVFNTRDKKGTLSFKTEDYDEAIDMLKKILVDGMNEGVFKPHAVDSAAVVIRAAIDQFLGLHAAKGYNADSYGGDIIALFDHALCANQH